MSTACRGQIIAIDNDRSVDLYFGPTKPDRRPANWIHTIRDRHYFSYMCFFGPLEPYFDSSWTLGDITPAGPPRTGAAALTPRSDGAELSDHAKQPVLRRHRAGFPLHEH